MLGFYPIASAPIADEGIIPTPCGGVTVPATDVLLRGVPSDTNRNDVRLADPTCADADTPGTITASSEDAASAAGALRYTSTDTSSSEDSANATDAERFVGTVTASSEDSANAVGAERYTSTATASTEDAAAASGAERFLSTATASTEDSAAAAGAERYVGTATASTEDSAAAVGAERFVGTETASSEDFVDAVEVEREVGSVTASSEDFADAVGVNTPPLGNSCTTSSEDSADAVCHITPPREEGGILGGGGPGFDGTYVQEWREWTTRITSNVSVPSETGVEAVGSVTVQHLTGKVKASGVAASAQGYGRIRLGGHVEAVTESSGDGVGEVSTRITEAQRLQADDEMVMMLFAAYEEYMDLEPV